MLAFITILFIISFCALIIFPGYFVATSFLQCPDAPRNKITYFVATFIIACSIALLIEFAFVMLVACAPLLLMAFVLFKILK